MPSNPLGGKKKANSVFDNTEKEAVEEQQPEATYPQFPITPQRSLPSQQPMRETEPIAAQKPVILPPRGIGQPSSHDRSSEVPFDYRYKKENIMVDRRLLDAYLHYLKHGGRSKVHAMNKLLAEFLSSKGYAVDPNIADIPFTWDDIQPK